MLSNAGYPKQDTERPELACPSSPFQSPAIHPYQPIEPKKQHQSAASSRRVLSGEDEHGFPSQTSAQPNRTPVDLDALSYFTERYYAGHGQNFDKQPGIDVAKCQRKLSLYGDTKKQMNAFQQPIEHCTYYHPEIGYVRATSILELHHPTYSLQELLVQDNYWIDVTAPSVNDMDAISKIFHLHPLTTEDILSQENREKCDVFQNYLFVCYRAFVQEEQGLKPVSFYNIILKRGILSFHFSRVPYLEHVYQRIEQLRHHMVVAPDWINYAILDEITDHFAPLIQQIEYEVESIDDPALLLNVNDDETEMVLRIGACRKRVMQMVRLLGTKADVVRGLMKRFDDRASCKEDLVKGHFCHPSAKYAADTPMTSNSWSTTNGSCSASSSNARLYGHRRGGSSSSFGHMRDRTGAMFIGPTMPPLESSDAGGGDGRMYPDVCLYLGDVQDHLIIMLQNLSHYETVLARAHSNYLAQISIRLSQTSNSTNYVIGRLTVFATILMPMNLVTGLWGMNVKVPGKDYDDLLYFFWIVTSLTVFAVGAFTLARKFRFF